MSGFALLHHGATSAPRTVHLSVADDRLILSGANGFVEEMAWWRLFRIGEERSIHRFRRLDRAEWELRVSAGADQALLAHVKQRSLARLLGPLHRLHLLKAFAAVVAAILALTSALPARWVAGRLPAASQARLVEGWIASQAHARCARAGGVEAIRDLLVRLDPQIGPRVEIVAIKTPQFIVSSLPAARLLLTKESTTAIEADALVALLAHELSHLRHGDPIVAAVRNEGNFGIFLALLRGPDRTSLLLQFSGEEEERADREAIQMMRRARISLAPAAALFEQMRIAEAQQSGFAFEQRSYHFGIADRARFWKQAADRDPAGLVFPLSADQADNLYNVCWAGPLPATVARPSRSEPPEPGRPGHMALTANPAPEEGRR